jgi:hypothetical protein
MTDEAEAIVAAIIKLADTRKQLDDLPVVIEHRVVIFERPAPHAGRFEDELRHTRHPASVAVQGTIANNPRTYAQRIRRTRGDGILSP